LLHAKKLDIELGTIASIDFIISNIHSYSVHVKIVLYFSLLQQAKKIFFWLVCIVIANLLFLKGVIITFSQLTINNSFMKTKPEIRKRFQINNELLLL